MTMLSQIWACEASGNESLTYGSIAWLAASFCGGGKVTFGGDADVDTRDIIDVASVQVCRSDLHDCMVKR